MLYQGILTIPANTDKTSPVETNVNVLPGTVNKVYILFPPGCNGLAHIEIYNKNRKVWPTSPDESFYGDTFPFDWEEDYLVDELPYVLTLRGWNLDNLYEHNVVVRFSILTGQEGWLQYFQHLVGFGK